MSAFSLYIPSVYANISAEMIAATFYRMKIGSVKHVELVRNTDKQNKAYVFFESMYPHGKGATMMRDVDEDKSVKLHYSKNQHVFWVMLKSRRNYDGKSSNGWYDVEAEEAKKVNKEDDVEEMNSDVKYILCDKVNDPGCSKYDEEVDSFMPNPTMDMVASDYASILENEISQLRYENMHLKMNADVMFGHYNQLLAQTSYQMEYGEVNENC
tara:strand:- start:19 stop:654 length:636 start_codon:yes stop_codon:yes gene_type:complete